MDHYPISFYDLQLASALTVINQVQACNDPNYHINAFVINYRHTLPYWLKSSCSSSIKGQTPQVETAWPSQLMIYEMGIRAHQTVNHLGLEDISIFHKWIHLIYLRWKMTTRNLHHTWSIKFKRLSLTHNCISHLWWFTPIAPIILQCLFQNRMTANMPAKQKYSCDSICH